MEHSGSRAISGSALSSDNQQIFTVEALRGLAALSVTWFHMTNIYSLNWVRYSGFHGWLGVEMLFVISGFIIPYSLHRSQYKLPYFSRFLLRRLVRLEPPYLLHVPIGGRVVNIGRRFVEGPVQELLLSIVALAVSLLAATIFWKYVEEPAKRASKRVALRAPISPLARS